MDAICAASAILSLIFNCATAVKACNDIRGKYKDADQTLRSISTEASILRASLLQLHHLMLRDPVALSSRWDVESMLPQTFETAIESFEKALAALLRELEKLNGNGKIPSSSGALLTRSLKIKLLWNEGAMQDILVQLRGHQQSLQFLLTILQMGSLSEIRNSIRENQELLRKLVRSTRKLEHTQSESSKRKSWPSEGPEMFASLLDEETTDYGTNSEEEGIHEPPAKRRSLSPEEEVANPGPTPSRTRSGRVYHPTINTTLSPASLNPQLTETPGRERAESSTISTSFKSTHRYSTFDSSRLRSRDGRHGSKRYKGYYGLGRSLSPSSSVVGSPLSQPSSPHTGKSHSTFSPPRHQVYDLQTPPYSPISERKQQLTPNQPGKRKATNRTPAPDQLYEVPGNALDNDTGDPESMNREHEMCIDQPITPETTLQIPASFRTQNYRSPRVESESEEDSDSLLIPSFLFEPDKEPSSDLLPSTPSGGDRSQHAGSGDYKLPRGFSPRYNSSGYYATATYQAYAYDSDDTSQFESPPILSTARPVTSKKPPTTPKATEDDARRHQIPSGYSLKNWDPAEEPILLLGSVFDSNSLGKWIYDWTVYHHGPATPIADLAGELWLLLIQLSGKLKRAEETMPRIRQKDNREMVDDFIESGERVTTKLKKLLKACETPMLKVGRRGDDKVQLGKNAGTQFVDCIFGRDAHLESTEKFMASVRLWNLRFDANCEDILRNPGQHQ